MGGHRHVPADLTTGKTLYGWVVPRDGLNRYRKSRHNRDSIPCERPTCSESLYRLPYPRLIWWGILNESVDVEDLGGNGSIKLKWSLKKSAGRAWVWLPWLGIWTDVGLL